MRRLVILAALGLVAAACGGGGDDGTLTLEEGGITPIPGNSELVVGPNRFALALIDVDNRPILEEPGTSVLLRFFFEDELKFEQDASFTWAIPDANGFFAASVDFDQAGQWQVEPVLTRDGEETGVRRFTFPVREESQYPDIGDPAPPSANLTLKEEPNIRRLSTDEEPEPALYQMTVAEALQAGKPLVVVFATPAFCQTRFCGPVVDNVEAMWQEYGDQGNFIHIEPFELDAEGQLAAGAQGGPVVSAPMLEWQLQTEPWVFVVDADGRIAARFEGTASPDEIRDAIQAALG
ncbi:MAG: hypothetical protein A2148_06970 [Chloroflexi bacterium RBG_16_68_14]|nr:MAG: hypothetical protein A2148_06970 [Chloroflexi bacterium RBG_16_68_14]